MSVQRRKFPDSFKREAVDRVASVACRTPDTRLPFVSIKHA